jgi:hypothetical protein
VHTGVSNFLGLVLRADYLPLALHVSRRMFRTACIPLDALHRIFAPHALHRMRMRRTV